MLIIGYAGNILENEQNAKQGRRKTTARQQKERDAQSEREREKTEEGLEKMQHNANNFSKTSALLPCPRRRHKQQRDQAGR